MKLSRVDITNYKGIRSAALELGLQLTLFVGENGSGKSSVLQAIALGLSEVLTYLPHLSGMGFRRKGDIHLEDGREAPYTRIALQTTSGLRWDRTLRRDRSASTTLLIPPAVGVKPLHRFLDQSVLEPDHGNLPFSLPVIAHYGVSRALPRVPVSHKGLAKRFHRFEALQRAVQASDSFEHAFAWFYYKEREEQRLQRERRDFDISLPELQVVRAALQSMFPDLSDPSFKLQPSRFVLRLNGQEFELESLSDGYKTLIGLTLDLSSRLATANPHLENPLTADAIVLIDELDLHLHPRWQMRVVQDLLRTFPNTQFVLSTHSPVIVEGVNILLKRGALATASAPLTADLEAIIGLPIEAVKAYHTTSQSTFESLLDPDANLLRDPLIDPFNAIGILFDDLCDAELDADLLPRH